MADITITEGEAVKVESDILNTGDITDTQDIVLEADGTEEDRQPDLQLAPDETGFSDLYFVTETGDAATYTVVVKSNDTEDSIEVEVTT